MDSKLSIFSTKQNELKNRRQFNQLSERIQTDDIDVDFSKVFIDYIRNTHQNSD